MKIVLAPDSFKGSLSAEGVCAALENGLRQVLPEAQIVKCPMADGGEGTLEAVVTALAPNGGARRKQALVRNAAGQSVEAALLGPALGWIVGPGLMGLWLFTLLFLSRYELTRAEHQHILATLARRRAEAA